MSIFFSVVEGIKSLTKARMAVFFSISSISLTLLLIGLFIIFNLNLQSIVGTIREKIEIEVFINVTANDKNISDLKKKVEKTTGIKSLIYVTKVEAANRFKEEFGQDIYEVLDYNPLQASFILSLEEGYRTYTKVNQIKNRLKTFEYVDDVVFQKPLLETLDRYFNILFLSVVAAGLIIIFIAVALIYNTVRLTIYARKNIIYIMRLVGATEGFVRRPFIVEGIVQGFIGSLIASVMIYYIVELIKTFVYPYIVFNPLIFAVLITFGTIIGLFSSFFNQS